MKALGHLRVDEIKLPAGQEWSDDSATWRFLRIHVGAAYWMSAHQNRPLAEGEVVIIQPLAKGIIRASQIGDVVLQGFCFAPDLFYGFFTLSERQALDDASGGKTAEVRFIPSTHPVAQNFANLAGGSQKANSLSQRLLALTLVTAVFEDDLIQQRPPVSLSTSALHRFKQIIARMPDTEIVNQPPEELAKMCGCSPRHFNRLFREHFGVSARDRQTELRLLKARQLLTDSNDKIIHVAMDSGYRNLSLFNGLFKRRFGMTPSDWRRKARKGLAKAACAVFFAAMYFGAQSSFAQVFADLSPAIPKTNVTENVAPGKSVGPTFEVTGYVLDGNTLLPPEAYEPIIADHVGPAIGFETIRTCLANLTIAYRVRGYTSVALSLPQQQITNGIVTIKVTEGKIVDVKVTGNRFFSTRNVLRTLPGLRTNEVLNSILLQAELDRANANRDRQIYPVVAPGPEPGTSVLELRIKDQRPLHARLEVNNHNTPNSPLLRLNLSASYDNLWQLEHQIGVQYSMTPQVLKVDHYDYIVDAPLITSYSAFYRMPLGKVNGEPRAADDSGSQAFGYDEATHKFNLPANSGRAEINIYASRSSSDSGRNLSSETLTPTTIPSGGALQVSDRLYNRTVSTTENLGFRFNQPLPVFWDVHSSLSAGVDLKSYQALSIQDRIFQATIFVPEVGNSGPPFIQFPSPPTASSRNSSDSVEYIPLAFNFDASRPDDSGSLSFQFHQSYEVTSALGHYYVINSGLTREQKFGDDWKLRLHADGQWANQPLFSNEQFGLGGEAGVRGYQEGETYGDAGWRATFELQTPQFEHELENVSDPMQMRIYTFFDCGGRYNSSSYVFRSTPPSFSAEPKAVSLAGTGAGISATIGDKIDMRLQFAFALLDFPYASEPIKSGDMRISFNVGAQF